MTSSGGPPTGETLVSTVERYCPSCDRSFPTTLERCPEDGTALVELSDDVDALIGLEIDGRFTIRRRLGKGGMGAAYAAVQHSIGREVAIKVIHPHLARDKLGAKRFLRETKIAAQLSHPNTVTVLDFGQTRPSGDAPRRLYMAMELIDGVTLSSVIRSGGAMALPRAISIATQLCDALAAAHRLDIVHRDLKPSNIMLEGGHGRGDHVKVLDFGLAKSLVGDDTTVTESNAIIGTPQYIAPELVVGDDADTRADLYSLGAVLFELVSGRPPFSGDSVQACLFSQVHDAPPPLPDSVPPALADVILQLLAKRPDLRFQSADEVREALERCRETSTSSGPVAALAQTLDRPRPIVDGVERVNTEVENEADPPPPNRWALWLGGLVALAGAGVIAFVVTRNGDGNDAASGPGETSAMSSGDTDSEAAATDPADASIAAAATRDSAPVVSTDAAPTGPTDVVITIVATPRGARASAGGTSCTSPCALRLPRGDEPVVVRFSKSGYRSEKRSLTPSSSETLWVELQRRGSKGSGKGSGDGSGKGSGDGFVQGYDDEP